MFNRKECKRCGEKSGGKSNFCPNCGVPFNGKQEKMQDFGMLGEDDVEEQNIGFSNSILGGIGGKMMNKMFESAVKMLEKEMEKEMKRAPQNPEMKTNFQLFINGKKINVEEGAGRQEQKIKKEISSKNLPQTNLKKFGDFPKREPETNVRRFSDKVIYEISVPGLKSEKDLSITKLENSIEIRALGNKVMYTKIIPINLPITDYRVSKEKIVLELGIKE